MAYGIFCSNCFDVDSNDFFTNLASNKSTIMKKIIALLVCVFLFIQIYSQVINGQVVSDDGQFKVVKVWGTHEQRGYAVGYLLGEGVNDLFDNYLMPAFGTYYSMARNLMLTDAHIKIDSVYIYEAMAMADGLNASGEMSYEVDYIDVLLANSFLDFQNFLTKGLGLDNGCSTLISWGDATAGTELDGKSVISRHLDWDDQQVIVRNQVMVIHFPAEENEQPWLLIGFAGQMSVLSGLNQSGVAVMQHMLADEYTAASLNKSYEPVWFTMRKSIELDDYNGDGTNNCLDINDAVLVNSNGYADSYIITGVAPSTNLDDEKIATIIEVAPSSPYITVRNTSYEDDIPNQNLYAANSSIARNDALNYCVRYNAVKANMGDGTLISKHENWSIMLDHSSACAFGGTGNIQFMQFAPEENYLKLAYHTTGGVQACENTPLEYNTLDLFELPMIVSQPKQKHNLKTYPNPATTEVFIYLPGNVGSDMCEIYNSTGSLVKTVSTIQGENRIDITELKPGAYFVKLRNSGLKSRFVVD